MAGNAELEEYHAEHLAADECTVVVTANYRLGPLGFLPTGAEEGLGLGNGGMNGVRDQITALGWVQSLRRRGST